MRLFFCSLFCALTFAAASPVLAQNLSNPNDVIASGTSYHIFAQPGEATVQVLVLGDVATGMYVVGANTNLVELLALTGTGASAGESANISREVTVRLMREQAGQRTVVYEEEFEGFLSQPGSYPTLQDGDLFTVEVTERQKFGLREAFDIAGRLSSITLLVLRLVDAF